MCSLGDLLNVMEAKQSTRRSRLQFLEFLAHRCCSCASVRIRNPEDFQRPARSPGSPSVWRCLGIVLRPPRQQQLLVLRSIKLEER